MPETFKLRGAKAMQRRMEGLARKYPDRVKAAMYREGELILADSKENYVPVDLGVLRSSGFVNPPQRSGKDVSVVIGYGGAAADYALSVHETPSPHDPPTWKGTTVTFSPDGRGPKYLEKPLKAAIPDIPRRLAESLDVERNNGGGGNT